VKVGLVQEIAVRPSSETAIGLTGGSGTVAGTTAVETAEAESPEALVATTLNVYDNPFVNPSMLQVKNSVEHVRLPGVEVTR